MLVQSQACSTKESRCNLQMFCVLAVMIVKGVVINKQHNRGQDSLQVPVLIQQRMLSVTSSVRWGKMGRDSLQVPLVIQQRMLSLPSNVSWGKTGRDSLQVPVVITTKDAGTNKQRELGENSLHGCTCQQYPMLDLTVQASKWDNPRSTNEMLSGALLSSFRDQYIQA